MFFGYGLDDFRKNWSAGKPYEQFSESDEAEDFIAKRATSRKENARITFEELMKCLMESWAT